MFSKGEGLDLDSLGELRDREASWERRFVELLLSAGPMSVGPGKRLGAVICVRREPALYPWSACLAGLGRGLAAGP